MTRGPDTTMWLGAGLRPRRKRRPQVSRAARRPSVKQAARQQAGHSNEKKRSPASRRSRASETQITPLPTEFFALKDKYEVGIMGVFLC